MNKKIITITIVFALILTSLTFFACGSGEDCNTSFTAQDIINTVKTGVVEVQIVGSRGSGVVVDKIDGNTIILTNLHVIRSSPIAAVPQTVQVRHYNSNIFVSASVIGYAADYDLAVLSTALISQVSHIFDFNMRPYQTQSVFSLGYITGIGTTAQIGTLITADGIMAAREINIRSGDNSYFAIATTAAFRAGMSGGALIDRQGRLLGIGTWGYMSDGIVHPFGLSYSIPGEVAAAVVDRVVERNTEGGQFIVPNSPRGLSMGFSIQMDGSVVLTVAGRPNYVIRSLPSGFYLGADRIERINGREIESMSMALSEIIRALNDVRFE